MAAWSTCSSSWSPCCSSQAWSLPTPSNTSTGADSPRQLAEAAPDTASPRLCRYYLGDRLLARGNVWLETTVVDQIGSCFPSRFPQQMLKNLSESAELQQEFHLYRLQRLDRRLQEQDQVSNGADGFSFFSPFFGNNQEDDVLISGRWWRTGRSQRRRLKSRFWFCLRATGLCLPCVTWMNLPNIFLLSFPLTWTSLPSSTATVSRHNVPVYQISRAQLMSSNPETLANDSNLFTSVKQLLTGFLCHQYRSKNHYNRGCIKCKVLLLF